MLKVKSVVTALVLTTALLVGVGGCGATTPAASTQTQAADLKVYSGLGQTAAFRVGPGKDANGGQLYSFTYATSNALFDKDGKIIDVNFDALEVMSPNDSEHQGVPKFSGWPGQAGFLGAAANTDATAATELSNWKTKRERGDVAYGLKWSEQFGAYQKFMKGKTVAEVEQWFAKNTSDVNGRPLTAKATDPKDVAKFAKLSDQEKTALADVTSGATISLKDVHGDYIGALKKAYANKVEVTVPTK